ncbi:MAG: hypothetical protein QW240_05105 [Candidatus Caldarchaeum sp.]
MTNTGRWVQWRWKAVDPPGECMDELSFLTELFRRIRSELKKERGFFYRRSCLRRRWA